IEDDGSIVFFCAVEEGMVLDVGGHEEMKPALERDVASFRARFGQADLLISFNCILRALEADKAGAHEDLGAVVQGCAKASVGVDTYGESYNGLHINQTMVAVAFRSAA
ncbi:MAG: FIST domain containing protein, partial [Verrucomicrobia bacterium]|nr:FIST domain containing protein [Verrucomicrobiota bacterium]